MNVWYNPATCKYHILFQGKLYTENSFVSVKERIDNLLPAMTINAMYQ